MSFSGWMETAAALVSLLLMGICGVQLLVRLIGLFRGWEMADGLSARLPKANTGSALSGPRMPSAVRAMLIAALITLVSRLALYALAYALYRLMGVGSDGFFKSFEPLWTHWDTRHYVGIAREGYTDVGDDRLRLVFFPLYPLLMRLFAPLAGGSVFYGGVLVSLLCASLCGALLYDLCRAQWDERTAKIALSYFLLNPLSVFLGCVYTESLFLFLTLLTVWLLRRGQTWLAALCGMASAFTRMPGVIIAGLFLIRMLGEAAQGRLTWRASLRCAGQMLLVFCGLFAYWGLNVLVTGAPFTYMIYQAENWFQQPGTFWASAANTMHYFLSAFGSDNWLFGWFFRLVTMFYAYALLAARSDRLPFDLAAYSFVYVAVVFAPTWLLSGARYLYALVALPMLQARAHEETLLHGFALAICGLLLTVWTFGYAIAVQVY